MISKQHLEELQHTAYERGYEKGYEKGKADGKITVVKLDEEDYAELVRKAERYDIMLDLYQKQLVRAVWYQDEILRLERVWQKATCVQL